MSVDKLVDSTQLNTDLTSVANAIRTKGGTSAQLAFPAEFVSAIAAIPSGGGDYDWSWVKNDGVTYLYIHVDDYNHDYRIKYYQNNTDDITVNWGDGNSETTNTRDHHTLTHTYSSSGDYVVSITQTNGNYRQFDHINGGSSGASLRYNSMLIKAEFAANNVDSGGVFTNCNHCEAIAYTGNHNSTPAYPCFGTNLFSLAHVKQYNKSKIWSAQNSQVKEFVYDKDATAIGACTNGYALKKVKIPKGVSGFPNNMFQDCVALEEVTFDTPTSITASGNNFLTRARSLKKIIIPEGITSLGTNCFYDCNSLEYVQLPSTLASIPSGWNSCGAMKEIHIAATTPPTLSGSYFSPFPSDWVLYVPKSENQAVLNEYKTATNWSTYANNMQEEPS